MKYGYKNKADLVSLFIYRWPFLYLKESVFACIFKANFQEQIYLVQLVYILEISG